MRALYTLTAQKKARGRERAPGKDPLSLPPALCGRERSRIGSSLAGGARFYGRCGMLRSRLFHTAVAQPRPTPHHLPPHPTSTPSSHPDVAARAARYTGALVAGDAPASKGRLPPLHM